MCLVLLKKREKHGMIHIKNPSSSLIKERKVAKSKLVKKSNDDEFENKNVPLIQPTFFD